ncbi:CPBP family intramembrane metalloprotease [Sedimentitalea sp. JM2-8]|uniref:CPBP family intramembrane metalloprotease n=1 Tax=Sedimentitalea xiamensis TaxID=3050037 RepID=A0ABT7FH63_9RHOB|nr:CPBP family glutamic-type intramembrane protease [Sedimentitalea xiamensis]MDK3074453.1 CPBP family intramembrane metalloprotease [Sedimentitalea xiamensis]
MANFPTDAERFGWLERDRDDFPYYHGVPVEITTGGWLVVLAGVALGFAALMIGPEFVPSGTPRFLLAFLFGAIPIAALALVAGWHWTALFRRLRAVDPLWMIGFAILNVLVTLVTGLLITNLTDATANSAIADAGQMDAGRALHFFALTGIQLIGEEVTSILPFLALLYWFSGRFGMGRRTAIILATLVVALLFSVEHGSTYDWNLVQVLLGVGVARIVLILPYIMTKNLAVSAGAHILNDWMFFGLSMLSAAAPATS